MNDSDTALAIYVREPMEQDDGRQPELQSETTKFRTPASIFEDL